MTEQLRARANDILGEALELPPAQRSDFVGRACDGDTALLQMVTRLLARAGELDGFMENTAPFVAELGRAPCVAPQPGERIGNWVAVREIGRGGMGVVMLVERGDGAVRQTAALKIIQDGAASDVQLTRFHGERQILANLNHPDIARLIDAGSTDDGRPYFVMEYSDGVPVDQYCADMRLTLAQRIELFARVCEAVQYAHQHLVIHRDLKPANILVAQGGAIKLLDFGIAKLQNRDPADGDGGAQSWLLTPMYASPEQLTGAPLTISTDIYSLGVVLYGLLTGRAPYASTTGSALEMLRQQQVQGPTRPSVAVTGSAAPQPILASDDVLTQGERLARHLRGDLDNIVLKAIQPAPAQRYASADAFARDLRRYLHHEPVLASAPSWWYRSRKMAQRYPLGVAASAAAVVSLVLGAGIASWQAHEAGLARDEAQRRLADVRSVTHDLVFRFGDSVSYLPGGMQIKEDLLNGTVEQLQRLADSAKDDPAFVADVSALHARLAELQGNDSSPSTDRPKEAMRHAERAIVLGQQIWAARKGDRQFSNWLARAHHVRAQMLRSEGKLQEAMAELAIEEQLVTESLALQTNAEDRAWLLGNRGAAQILEAQVLGSPGKPNLNKPDQALERFREAERTQLALLALGDKALDALDASGRPEEPKTKPSLLHALATIGEARALINLERDKVAQAVVDATTAVNYQQQALALDPKTIIWQDGLMRKENTLAVALLRSSTASPSDALAAAQTSWDIAARLMRDEAVDGPTSKSLPALGLQYGRALALSGRHADALPVFSNAIAAFQKMAEKDPPIHVLRRLGWLQTAMSRSLLALNRHDEGVALARQALIPLRSAHALNPQARDAVINLAQALAWLGKIDPVSAVAHLAEARELYGRAGNIAPLLEDNAAALAAL